MQLAQPVHAQSLPTSATAAPSIESPSGPENGTHPRWTEALGVPTIYVEHARVYVARGRYRSAARTLRKAARILSARAQRGYGLDRARLAADVEALRLTARDVAAGAVTSPAQLDSVLDNVHRAVIEHRTASR
jgi:hypothetical protein